MRSKRHGPAHWTMMGLFLVHTSLVVLGGCGGDRSQKKKAEKPGAPTAGADSTETTRNPTRIEMRNVDLNIHEGVILRVRRLSGTMHPVHQGQPVRLDDPVSFTITVDTGETTIDYDDLSALMNKVVFAFPGAPIKSIQIEREEDRDQQDRLELKLKLAQALGIPAEIEGKPEVTPDGNLRVRTMDIQVANIEVGGLLDLLHLKAEDIIKNMEDRGVVIEGNDVILILNRILPPPRVDGKVRSVKIEADRMEILLGSGERRETREQYPNYLWFRGNVIRLGRMTMTDTDLKIVDNDAGDPFDFTLNKLNHQLVAGYAKLSEEGALTMFTPDYGDIGTHK